MQATLSDKTATISEQNGNPKWGNGEKRGVTKYHGITEKIGGDFMVNRRLQKKKHF
jgi:hypothetical protein